MTGKKLEKIYKLQDDLVRSVSKKLNINEFAGILQQQGIDIKQLQQFDTSPIYNGEFMGRGFKKGYKQWNYLGFRVFDDPVIKLYFIVKRVFAGYPEEYPVPIEEILYEIPAKLHDCGTGATYIGGKGCRYIDKFYLKDLETHFQKILKKVGALKSE